MSTQTNSSNIPFQKKEKVPTKVSAAFATNLQLNPDSVPGPVVVVITSGDFTRQLTIHRPIGHVPFDNDCWCITPTGDVPSFLNHAKDPSYEKKAEAKRKLRLAIAVKLDLLCENGHYKGATLQQAKCNSFKDAIAEATKLHKVAASTAHEEYLDECKKKGRTPKKDWKFNQNINHFLTKEVKDVEELIAKKVKETSEWEAGLKVIEPEPFETKGGVFHQTSQVPFCRNPCEPRQMVDMVQQHIMSTILNSEKRYFPSGSTTPAFGFEDKGMEAMAAGKAVGSKENLPMTGKTYLDAVRAKIAGADHGNVTKRKTG